MAHVPKLDPFEAGHCAGFLDGLSIASEYYLADAHPSALVEELRRRYPGVSISVLRDDWEWCPHCGFHAYASHYDDPEYGIWECLRCGAAVVEW